MAQYIRMSHHLRTMSKRALYSRLAPMLIITLAISTLAALAAPVPSSAGTATHPTATPTPWRYPDTDDNGVCRDRTKPECIRNAVALTLGLALGLPVCESAVRG